MKCPHCGAVVECAGKRDGGGSRKGEAEAIRRRKKIIPKEKPV